MHEPDPPALPTARKSGPAGCMAATRRNQPIYLMRTGMRPCDRSAVVSSAGCEGFGLALTRGGAGFRSLGTGANGGEVVAIKRGRRYLAGIGAAMLNHASTGSAVDFTLVRERRRVGAPGMLPSGLPHMVMR